MVSSIAFKIAMSALVALLLVMTLDEANGTFNGRSPAWINIPGCIAGLTFIGAGVIGVIAMIWGF